MKDPQTVKPVMLDSWGSEVYPDETVFVVHHKGKTLQLCSENFHHWVKDLSDEEIMEAFDVERRFT